MYISVTLCVHCVLPLRRVGGDACQFIDLSRDKPPPRMNLPLQKALLHEHVSPAVARLGMAGPMAGVVRYRKYLKSNGSICGVTEKLPILLQA